MRKAGTYDLERQQDSISILLVRLDGQLKLAFLIGPLQWSWLPLQGQFAGRYPNSRQNSNHPHNLPGALGTQRAARLEPRASFFVTCRIRNRELPFQQGWRGLSDEHKFDTETAPSTRKVFSWGYAARPGKLLARFSSSIPQREKGVVPRKAVPRRRREPTPNLRLPLERAGPGGQGVLQAAQGVLQGVQGVLGGLAVLHALGWAESKWRLLKRTPCQCGCEIGASSYQHTIICLETSISEQKPICQFLWFF